MSESEESDWNACLAWSETYQPVDTSNTQFWTVLSGLAVGGAVIAGAGYMLSARSPPVPAIAGGGPPPNPPANIANEAAINYRQEQNQQGQQIQQVQQQEQQIVEQNFSIPVQSVLSPVTNFQQPVSNFPLPPANFQQPVTNFPLPAMNFQQPISNPYLPNINSQLSATNNVSDLVSPGSIITGDDGMQYVIVE